MSRLRLLNDEINSIGKEADAIKLVKTWLPHQAETIDNGFMRTQPGVRNCALIAEFAITYLLQGKVNKNTLIFGDPTEVVKWPYATLPLGSGDGAEGVMLGTDGHNMALLREGNTYALFQAWEGRFHVFPKLNPSGEHFNAFGDGKAAQAGIARVITAVVDKSSLDVRRG
jgi:hypothetical protein